MATAQVLVVGGGPAGTAAALEARRQGARVVLVDERPALGGRAGMSAMADLSAQVRVAGVDIWTSTLVWDVIDDRTLDVLRQGVRQRLRGDAVVLAPGADVRVVPVPGWDLDGVVPLDEAIDRLTSAGPAPVPRVVVAGSGPYLLSTAAALARAGALVVAVASSTPFARQRDQPLEGLRSVATLVRRGTHVLSRYRLVRVIGVGRAQRAVLARVDRRGRVIDGSERAFDVDAVCVGDGFVPGLQLTRLFGCDEVYAASARAWTPRCLADQATLVSGVFVAGDAGLPRGVASAVATGRLAGLMAGAYASAGVVDSARAARLRRDVERQRRAQAPTAPMPHVEDEVVVCRCEGVSAGDIRRAISPWTSQLKTLRGLTRAGMGMCQGRLCESAVAAVVSQQAHVPVQATGTFSARPPLRPIALAALAEP